MGTPLSLYLAASDSVDVWEAIRQNDTFGKITLVFIVILSVYSFTVIFYKFKLLYAARTQTKAFQKVMEQDGSWETLFLATKKFPESPLSRLLRDIYIECRMEKWFEGNPGLSLEGRLNHAKQTIEAILMKGIAQEEERLQKQLTVLSTVSGLGPFAGLVGTVWGVLSAFQAIGRAEGAALASLAPAISTALMTTMFGLFAAIPALIAYNYFYAQVRELTSEMESFANDLENAVRKQIARDRGAEK